jgi:hypothetical protein
MRKELPLNESAQNNSAEIKPTPRPDNLVKNKPPKELSLAEVKNLYQKVRPAMNEFIKKDGWPLAREKAFKKVMGISDQGELSEKERLWLHQLAVYSGSFKAKKEPETEIETKLKSETFTPDERKRLIAGANEWQQSEEQRAGKTYEESGFEG